MREIVELRLPIASYSMKSTLIAVVLFLLCSYAHAQNEYSLVVRHYHEKQNFNGTVLVASAGKIDFLAGVGLANRRDQSAISAQTKFKIASITKTFTAVLVLQLVEQGLLDLDVNFGKYYPSYPGDAKNKVTLRHLLTYSSGIPNTAEKLGMQPYQTQLNIDTYIQKYCSENVAEIPGEKSNYSNTEYIILHKIIENITQKLYAQVLQEQLLMPLNMLNTGFLTSNSSVKGLAESYTIDDSTQNIAPDEAYFIENYFGAGAMYSTVEDLLKFDYALFNNNLLKPSTRQMMLHPSEKLNGVGLGVWYAEGYGTFNKPFVYRTGGILGACSNWIHTLDDNKTIIVFNNTNGTNLYELSEQLYLVSKGQKAGILEK